MSQNKLNWLDIADLTDEQVMNHLYVAFNEKNIDKFRLLIDEAQQGIFYNNLERLICLSQ